MSGTGGCPDIHIHNYSGPSVEQLDRILELLAEIRRDQHAMAVNLADIQTAVTEVEGRVAAQGSVLESAVTLMNELSAMVTEAATDLRNAIDNGTDEEIQAQLDRLTTIGQTVTTQRETLAAAVAANTPAAPDA